MSEQGQVAILSAVRTAVGSFGGSLAGVPVTALGAAVIKEALKRSGLEPGHVDEVVFGNVLQAGAGLNPARKAQVEAGIPEGACSYTVNHACGSGLKAVALGAQSILTGEADVVVAGGMESMSRAPYLLTDARTGYRLGHGEVRDSILADALVCSIANVHMGETAENIATEYSISRADQDEYAVRSHQRAVRAIDAGHFREEITPVTVPRRKADPLEFAVDEHPRRDTSLKALAGLRPVFKANGCVTAGNASGINDGAAAVVLTSCRRAESIGIEPMAVVAGAAAAGVSPRTMGMGPVPAIRRLLERVGWRTADVDLFEINEAFAAQALAVIRELRLDEDRVNVNGGALALGHPIGASGARILVTLLHALRRQNLCRGVAALCIGGGQGIALAVERR